MLELHKEIPRDLEGNLRWRQFILTKAKGNPELQQALWQYCSWDILFYINTFLWQTNPNADNEKDTIGPFITWPFQERAILSQDPDEPGILWCIDNRKSLVIEKSRFMGATWLMLIVRDWKCRFTPYYDSLMMSKSATAVDDASRQSLFGKLRFINEHLPRWLHDPDQFLDNKNAFIYPKTHSSQKGFASTGKAGVSERGRDFFIDEYTQIEDDWEVLYRTRATSKCRIFVATHLGEGTAFYSLSRNPKFRKLVFHWTQSPMLNKGMYRFNAKKPDGGSGIEFLKHNEQTDELEIVDQPFGYTFPADYDFIKNGEPVGGPHPGVRSPAYDEAFIEMGENLAEMAKDWDINPSGSVGQFYQAQVIKQLADDLAKPPLLECELVYDRKTGIPEKLVYDAKARIKLWCNLDSQGRPPRAVYGAGADISAGTGCTPSCISIWRGDTGEKVLEYMNANIKPDEFAILCAALCRLFCDHDGTGAKIAWENQGPGVTFGKTIWDELKYMRVYCAEGDDRFGKRVSDKPGWNPTGAARLALHTAYRRALLHRQACNRSRHALDETLNFKHDGKGSVEHTQYKSKNDPAGGRENHGDVVIADALGWKMIEGVARQEVVEQANTPPPGSLAHSRMKREQDAARAKLLYPNWDQRRRYAALR